MNREANFFYFCLLSVFSDSDLEIPNQKNSLKLSRRLKRLSTSVTFDFFWQYVTVKSLNDLDVTSVLSINLHYERSVNCIRMIIND